MTDLERRKNGGLTDEQVTAITDAILSKIYEDIGRSIVKKALWICGILLLTLFGWLAGAGHIKVPGATE